MPPVDLVSYANACEWGGTSFLFISSNVFDPLIYYSHILPVVISLPLAIFIFLKSSRPVISRLFLLLVGLFSFWCLADLILWAHNDPRYIMFFWSLIILVEPLIYVSALYLFLKLVGVERIPTGVHAMFIIVLLPLALLLPTPFTIESFNLTNCNREVTEGFMAFYPYTIEAVIAISILITGIYSFFKKRESQLMTVILTAGFLLFLFSFSLGNIAGSFLEDWTIGQYGLFGMPIFIAFIAYVMARFQIFQSKTIGVELLVFLTGVLLLGPLLLDDTGLIKTVGIVTFILFGILGLLMVRSVRREYEQRLEIETLAKDLKVANEKLKELDKLKSQFLSIASHDLRAPLTIVRNFISLLLDGTYGKLSKAAEEGLAQVFERATDMTKSVDTYLNVSRIEQGSMKYDFIEVELAPIIQKAITDFKPNAEKKGLSMVLTILPGLEGKKAKLDVTKINEVLNNLLDNSIKYTPKGSISVSVEKAGNVARMTIQDTGVGMTQETIGKLFKLFSTAEDSRKTNVSSTGVGLYITKAHVLAHGGKVWAESDGEGKGSRFILELPLVV